MPRPLRTTILCCLAIACLRPGMLQSAAPKPPNVLLIVAEDMSWLHLGCYGDNAVNTPAIDRLAADGVRFNYAYTAAPSCTASRSALLTGQEIWRLEEGGVFGCTLPREIPVFPLLLEESGYRIGYTGKGWGPGNLRAGGWDNKNPLGKAYKSAKSYAANLKQFLEAQPKDKPFFFWCGTYEAHRGFAHNSGLKAGKQPADARLPNHLPAVPTVQNDLLDYYVEIERLDAQVGRMIQTLGQHDALKNTLIIFTADNGMPFPRGKANLYDLGTRMPLVIAWPLQTPGGRVLDDFVSLTDLGPTILAAAGTDIPDQMTGRSLMPILTSNREGRVDTERDAIVLGHERHTHLRRDNRGYPVRAIRTHRYTYLRNYHPERWPAGDPDIVAYDRGYHNIDRGPTKQWMMARADDPTIRPLFELSFGKRPAEELYDLQADPWQMRNLADDPKLAEVKKQLRQRMEQYLTATNDPRARGESPWDNYPCLYGRFTFDPKKQ